MNLWWRLLTWWLRPRVVRPARASLRESVTTSFRVVPADLDVLGHMNNARYLALMDLGRYDILQRCGWWKQFQRRGWYAVVGVVELDEIEQKPGGFSDALRVDPWITEWTAHTRHAVT